VSTTRAGFNGVKPVAAAVGSATGTLTTPVAAAWSTVKLQLTWRAEVLASTRIVPCGSTERGMMIIALSPCRICCATPLVFCAVSTQASIGPFGPTNVALALFAASGIMAMIGRPAGALHPQ
jgi:hypothetical protein